MDAKEKLGVFTSCLHPARHSSDDGRKSKVLVFIKLLGVRVLQIVILTLFPALLVFGAVSDLLTFKIPNWVSLALVGLFVAAAPFAGVSWAVIGSHLAIGLILLLAGMGMFALKLLGGGDAKLLAAAGLWMGWAALPSYFFWVAIVGGMLAFALVAFRRAPLATGIAEYPWISRLHDRGAGIPYGIALAAGALMTFPQTIWFSVAAIPA